MEAIIFTDWIYDHLLLHAQQVKVAHPLMLRAIGGKEHVITISASLYPLTLRSVKAGRVARFRLMRRVSHLVIRFCTLVLRPFDEVYIAMTDS